MSEIRRAKEKSTSEIRPAKQKSVLFKVLDRLSLELAVATAERAEPVMGGTVTV